MRKIIECVPNFSEGRDSGVIEAIAASIRATSGCSLLDVDPASGRSLAIRRLALANEEVDRLSRDVREP